MAHGTEGHDFEKSGPLRLPIRNVLALSFSSMPKSQKLPKVVCIVRETGTYEGKPAVRFVGTVEGEEGHVVLSGPGPRRRNSLSRG